VLVELCSDVLTVLETLELDKYAVTVGEPAASDGCSGVYVWGISIYDSDAPLNPRGDDAGCFFRRTYEIGYRIDLCHKVRGDGKELTASESLKESTEVYDAFDEAWCALASAASDETLFPDISGCEYVVIGELEISDPLGDRVSGTGIIKVTAPCTT